MPKKSGLSEDEVLVFIYRNGKGLISVQEVSDITEDDTYIQGFSINHGELRTYRKDRVLESVSPDTPIAERMAFYQDTLPPAIPLSDRARIVIPHRNGVPEVCFTGFKAEDKTDLCKLAEGWGMVVRTTVSSRLTFLCYGYNAGPIKMERARKQGVTILSEYQFRTMLDTGEVPESCNPETLAK
nr:BRCT domain-containing protein [Thiocapsa sp. KS1]